MVNILLYSTLSTSLLLIHMLSLTSTPRWQNRNSKSVTYQQDSIVCQCLPKCIWSSQKRFTSVFSDVPPLWLRFGYLVKVMEHSCSSLREINTVYNNLLLWDGSSISDYRTRLHIKKIQVLKTNAVIFLVSTVSFSIFPTIITSLIKFWTHNLRAYRAYLDILLLILLVF